RRLPGASRGPPRLLPAGAPAAPPVRIAQSHGLPEWQPACRKYPASYSPSSGDGCPTGSSVLCSLPEGSRKYLFVHALPPPSRGLSKVYRSCLLSFVGAQASRRLLSISI